VFGLLGFASTTQFGSGGVPDGYAIPGAVLFGVEINGWSNLLHASAGVLLMFSAFGHRSARASALLCGLLFAAITAVCSFDADVAGLLPANGATVLVWACGAAALLACSILPARARPKATTSSRASDSPAVEMGTPPVISSGRFRRVPADTADTPVREHAVR
jgi:hypothetical protein